MYSLNHHSPQLYLFKKSEMRIPYFSLFLYSNLLSGCVSDEYQNPVVDADHPDPGALALPDGAQVSMPIVNCPTIVWGNSTNSHEVLSLNQLDLIEFSALFQGQPCFSISLNLSFNLSRSTSLFLIQFFRCKTTQQNYKGSKTFFVFWGKA